MEKYMVRRSDGWFEYCKTLPEAYVITKEFISFCKYVLIIDTDSMYFIDKVTNIK